MLVGVLQQIVDGMEDVQILFKSSRRRRRVQKIEPVLDRIHKIYETLLMKDASATVKSRPATRRWSPTPPTG